MNMQIKVNGFTYEFFPATMNGVSVIGCAHHNGTESTAVWSPEPGRLPLTELEAEEYLSAYSWQIVDSTEDFRAATMAEYLAVQLGGDGTRWISPTGTPLTVVMARYAARTEAEDELIRYEFRDGSAIVAGESGWDIEGEYQFSWRSLEEA